MKNTETKHYRSIVHCSVYCALDKLTPFVKTERSETYEKNLCSDLTICSTALRL